MAEKLTITLPDGKTVEGTVVKETKAGKYVQVPNGAAYLVATDGAYVAEVVEASEEAAATSEDTPRVPRLKRGE